MAALPVLTVEEVRAVEAQAARAGGPGLMLRAGRAVAETARRMARDTGGTILVVAGPGNNGGDAWVAAQSLRESFHRVTVLDADGTAPKADEARAAREAYAAAGGTIVSEWPNGADVALVVDGLLGVGLARDAAGTFRALIERMNATAAPVLAIDVPSGLDATTGRVRGAAVNASLTLTFIAHKPGLHTADGPDHCGVVDLDDLGVGAEAARMAHASLILPRNVAGWLAARARNSHKGDFGTVGVVGGERGMVGAALLTARAALLTGAGRVQVALLGDDAPAVDLVHPELMLRSVAATLASDVIVAGPGAGHATGAAPAPFEAILASIVALDRPIVLDADALNAVASREALQASLRRRHAPTLITPHPAEAARLLAASTQDIQADRVAAALELASRYRANVVLKGAGSICAFPDGTWSINGTGNPALATAGSGDVLAGIIGAMLAQHLEAPRALQYAVCLHGAAADALVARGEGPVGITASEIAGSARRQLNAWATGVV